MPRPPKAPRELTRQSRNALEYAGDLARQLNHRYIGPEHLMAGLAHDPGSMATEILARLWITEPEWRARVASHVRLTTAPLVTMNPRVPRPPQPQGEKELRYEATLTHLLQFAEDGDEEKGDSGIGTQHLLLALARYFAKQDRGNLPVVTILQSFGLSPRALEAVVTNYVQDQRALYERTFQQEGRSAVVSIRELCNPAPR